MDKDFYKKMEHAISTLCADRGCSSCPLHMVGDCWKFTHHISDKFSIGIYENGHYNSWGGELLSYPYACELLYKRTEKKDYKLMKEIFDIFIENGFLNFGIKII